jgi:hypothetical protein
MFTGKRKLKETTPPGWMLAVNDKAWMREDLMITWLQTVIKPYTDKRPCLLVMDSFAAHLTPAVRQEMERLNVTPAVIPGGCTCKAQPLDVVLNKPLKDRIRGYWCDHMAAQVTERREASGGEMVSVASLHMGSKADCIRWIDTAIGELSGQPEMIQKSFRVTGIANALSGSEDHMYRSDSVVTELVGQLLEDDDDDNDFDGFIEDDIPSVVVDPFADCD